MSPKRCLLLSSCLAALVAVPLPLTSGQTIPLNQATTPPPTPTPEVAGEAVRPVISESGPSGISDWALAGVVWSDASLTRRLAADALSQAQSDGAGSPTQESLQQLATQSEQIIKSLEQFGWSHKRAESGGTSPVVDPAVANPSLAAVPAVTQAAPSTQEIIAAKMRAAEAVGEAEAIVASPLKPLPTASNRMSQRDGQTLSATLPYSAGSIYDRGDYLPGGSYLSGAPVPVDASGVYTSELNEVEREVGREKSIARARDERKQESKPQVDPRVTAGLLRRIQMDDYTTAPLSETPDTAATADSRWVQFRLEANQWTYSRVRQTDRIPAARAALLQLQATAMTAGKSTQDERLKQILAPIMKLSL